MIHGEGSPFNAASRIVVDKEHYEVIAGVNIPMLVETLMARDDDPSFDELVALAVETGREGVKALKAKPIENAAPGHPLPQHPKWLQLRQNQWDRNDYMVIGLARIDDRLIHGQVATRWTKKPMSPVLLLLVMKWLRIPFVRHCSPRLHLRA